MLSICAHISLLLPALLVHVTIIFVALLCGGQAAEAAVGNTRKVIKRPTYPVN